MWLAGVTVYSAFTIGRMSLDKSLDMSCDLRPSVKAVLLATRWSRDWSRLQAVSLSDKQQVVHTDVALLSSAVTPCSWEGNRRSGVVLTMLHRRNWFIRLQAELKGGEQPAYTYLGMTF